MSVNINQVHYGTNWLVGPQKTLTVCYTYINVCVYILWRIKAVWLMMP